MIRKVHDGVTLTASEQKSDAVPVQGSNISVLIDYTKGGETNLQVYAYYRNKSIGADEFWATAQSEPWGPRAP